jgi:hypothetical protein
MNTLFATKKSFKKLPYNEGISYLIAQKSRLRSGILRLGFLGRKGHTLVFPFRNKKA